jgi:hypothetical protein
VSKKDPKSAVCRITSLKMAAGKRVQHTVRVGRTIGGTNLSATWGIYGAAAARYIPSRLLGYSESIWSIALVVLLLFVFSRSRSIVCVYGVQKIFVMGNI